MPDETVTIKDAFPALRERADSGDQGAACWLGVELLRGRDVLDDQAAESRRSDGTWQAARSFPRKPQTLEGLRRTERRLELAQRCQGVSADMTSGALDWLFTSAKAGSAGALALMTVDGTLSATQYPDGAQLRRVLDAQEEMLVMGLRVGSTRALQELTLNAVSGWNWGRIRSPNVPKMARSDRAALALFVEMLETRIRTHHVDLLPVERPDLKMPMIDSSDVPPAVRAHVTRLVDEVFAEGWANRDEVPLAGFDDLETDKACARFIAPRASESSVTAWLKP
ncbi:MAG: hypothetical protein IPK97_20240 [Ahniella sp.]|nr:hypothetical protein [Ahniella sp.]